MIAGFDGLRAFAVMLMLFTHKTAWGASAEIGFAGVWLFFLLSGFLIGGQLMTARIAVETGRTTQRQELGLFWLKRAFRIFPAYYVLIALIVPVYLVEGRDMPGLSWYLSYLSNFYFQQHQPEFLTTWAHFWTLAVEEQFYVLFAPLILLIPSRFASVTCIVLIGASLVQRFGLAAVGVKPYVIYIDSVVNFGLLSFGALLCFHRDRVGAWLKRLHLHTATAGWIAMGAVAIAAPASEALAGGNLAHLQIFYVISLLIAAGLMMNIAMNQKSRLVRALEWRPIAYTGQISYGLYLYNDYAKNDFPLRGLRFLSERVWSAGQVPSWVQTALVENSPANLMFQFAGLVLCFGLIFAAATGSRILVEKPALRLRNRCIAALKNGPTGAPLQAGTSTPR